MTDDARWAHAGKQISGAQRRALQVVADCKYGITARNLAKRMWPQSQSWSHPTTRGKKVLYGQGIQLRAGTILEQLSNAGLVHRGARNWWHATIAGRDFLENGRLNLDDTLF